MKLTRTAQGGTLEDFYSRNLDPTYEYYSEPFAIASGLMLTLIHYLEQHSIGFDKSVGTRLHNLTFRELTPNTVGEVWVSAWFDHYTISYWLTEQQFIWPGVERIEGVTPSVVEAAQMIVTAFSCAFHTFDPVAERRAMIEWAITEHPPQPEPVLVSPQLRAERIALRRIPAQQPESVRHFYQQLHGSTHPRWSREGSGMLTLIDYLETHQVELPGWVYTHEHDLVFTSVPEQQPGVTIQPIFEGYLIKSVLKADDAPWQNAYCVGTTNTYEEAASMLQAAVHYLFG